MMSHDTRSFLPTKILQSMIFKTSGAMILLLKAVFPVSAENVAAGAKNVFVDTFTLDMRKLSALNKRNSDYKIYGVQ